MAVEVALAHEVREEPSRLASAWDRVRDYVSGWLALPGLVLVGLVAIWRQQGRDPVAGAAVPVRYEPPAGLSPAEAAGYLHAAVRESREEVGLWPDVDAVIDGTQFVAVGHWTTPEDAPRRYDTRFFLARHPGGEATVCDPELVDVWWERPSETLERLERGELDAIAPTISFLTALLQYRNVEEAFSGTDRSRKRIYDWGVTTL